MKRCALWVALAAGCSAPPPTTCDNAVGACIDLEVAGSDGVTLIDQLEVILDGATTFDGTTPATAGNPMLLPIHTAVLLHDTSGAIDIELLGHLRGQVVGVAYLSETLLPDQHAAFFASLVPPLFTDGGALDRAAPLPDLTPLPRLIFLLPATAGNLGGLAGADGACTQAATAAQHAGTFVALLATPSAPTPAQRIQLDDRTIALVDGTPIAEGADLWKGKLLNPIQLQANGDAATTDCVWTDATASGQLAQPGTNDCNDWQDATTAYQGATGDPLAFDGGWAAGTQFTCDTRCHVYCIEQ